MAEEMTAKELRRALRRAAELKRRAQAAEVRAMADIRELLLRVKTTKGVTIEDAAEDLDVSRPRVNELLREARSR